MIDGTFHFEYSPPQAVGIFKIRSILFFILFFFVLFVKVLPAASKAPLKVIVLPFEIHSLEDISKVRVRVLDSLATQLDGLSELKVVDGKVLNRIVSERGKETFTEDEAFSIGVKEKTDFVVTGSITKIGSSLSLDIKVLNVSLGSIAGLAYIEDSNVNRLLKKLSSLTSEVRKIALKDALNIGKEFVENREVIGKVVISGNVKVDSSAILSKIKTKVGGPLSKEQIREDIKSIYNMGFFSDIIVDLEDTVIGKEVTFIVKEKPKIREIEIEGNKEIKKDKIREVITAKPNTILKRSVLKQDTERIKVLYARDGFYLARVNYRLVPSGDDTKVVFSIKEGRKVKIKSIDFIGNTVFTDKELKSAIRTKEASILSFITRSGIFDDFVFDNDLNIILGKYFDEGYIKADVMSPHIQISEDKKWLFITVNIKEGDRYRVGKVDIKGDMLKTRMELMEIIETAPDKVFSRSVLGRDISKLTDLYADEGYAFVDVHPVTEVKDESKIVNITFDIDQGDKVRLERIDINGNVKTRDKVIRRELEISEGELYSSTKLRRSRRNLNRLGYFDDVKITSQQGSAKDKMLLKVDVKERPTGAFSIGAGYSSVDNFIASLSISQNNLFGTGRKLRAEGTISSSSKRYNISFTEPWLFDRHISAGFDLFRTDRDFPSFSRFSNGGDVRLGFEVFKDTRYSFTYTLQKVKVNDVAPDASILIKDQEGNRLESSVLNVIKRDTLNSFFDPTEGSLESFSLEFAGGFLGGDNNFVKYKLEAGKYFPMPWKTTVHLKGRLGYIHGFGNRPIPIYERFFLGGINTIRGFETRSIGPKDPGTDEVIGGDKEWVLNLEYIFPIIEKQKVKGLMFFDAGNTYDVGDFDLGDVRYGAGFGIRWLSPMGLLRLEWGFNLNRKEDEKANQFEFSIGGSL